MQFGRGCIASSDVLVLAVKPNVLPDVVMQLKNKIIEKSPLVISIAAGKSLEFLEGLIAKDFPIVRVSPI